MTERKPPGVDFESWVDKKIREAAERGEFEDLPGLGEPLRQGRRDELWWIRDKVEREGLSTEALLPEPLQLRREIERLPESVRELRTEQQVRNAAETLNRRVVEWLRAPSGPRVPVSPVDVDALVESWRAERAAAEPPARPEPAEPPSRAPWWRRWFGRGAS